MGQGEIWPEILLEQVSPPRRCRAGLSRQTDPLHRGSSAMRCRNLLHIRNEGTRSSSRDAGPARWHKPVASPGITPRRTPEQTWTLLSLSATTTELASARAPVYGQAETFTATVVPPQQGTGRRPVRFALRRQQQAGGLRCRASGGAGQVATFTTTANRRKPHLHYGQCTGAMRASPRVFRTGLGFSPVSEVSALGSNVWGIVTGPDHALWFTTENGLLLRDRCH